MSYHAKNSRNVCRRARYRTWRLNTTRHNFYGMRRQWRSLLYCRYVYSLFTVNPSQFRVQYFPRIPKNSNKKWRLSDLGPPTPNTHSTKRTRTQHCSLRMYSSHVHTVLLIISTELIQSSPFDVSEIWEVTSYNVNISCPVVKRDTDAPIQDWRQAQPAMEIGASVWVRDPEQSWVSSTVVSKVRYRSHTLVSFHHSIWPLVVDVFT